MEIVLAILLVFSVFAVVITLLPLLNWDVWWVRIFDFPRLQIAFFHLLLLIAALVFVEDGFHWWYLIIPALIGCFIYQLTKIFRYTPLAASEVKKYNGTVDNNQISILVSNVLASNRNAEPLLKLAERKKPDILLTLESDYWWDEQLSRLEDSYPYTVKVPLDNQYGMHLFSKLKLNDPQVKYLLEDDVPSIHTSIRLNGGQLVQLRCLHPKPPSPTQSGSSTDRDAELLMVAREVEGVAESVLVFGDLNDVAWSHTTRMFQKVSSLLDPRIGRGFFNTFNANYPIFRWPLDHIFHSPDFTLIEIRRLENIGSDHFPIFAALQFQPEMDDYHDTPDADSEEEQEADEKIAKGRN